MWRTRRKYFTTFLWSQPRAGESGFQTISILASDKSFMGYSHTSIRSTCFWLYGWRVINCSFIFIFSCHTTHALTFGTSVRCLLNRRIWNIYRIVQCCAKVTTSFAIFKPTVHEAPFHRRLLDALVLTVTTLPRSGYSEIMCTCPRYSNESFSSLRVLVTTTGANIAISEAYVAVIKDCSEISSPSVLIMRQNVSFTVRFVDYVHRYKRIVASNRLCLRFYEATHRGQWALCSYYTTVFVDI